jgi:hypothetical protein
MASPVSQSASLDLALEAHVARGVAVVAAADLHQIAAVADVVGLAGRGEIRAAREQGGGKDQSCFHDGPP